jgi:hypothetical protein
MTGKPGLCAAELIGSWRKVDTPECAEGYPEFVTFYVGTYRGTPGDRQGFIWWDAGTYRLEDGKRIVLSVATDALVSYDVRHEGDVLEFTDPDGCRFSYQRISAVG